MNESICRSCFHSYVCEQFNEHREGNNKECHFFNDHFVHAADVVEVVRCKDCKHFTAGYCCRDINGRSQMHYMGESAFCSYGAKMDGKGESHD